jgi:hypothetical protein
MHRIIHCRVVKGRVNKHKMLKTTLATKGEQSTGPLRILAVGSQKLNNIVMATALVCTDTEHINIRVPTAVWPPGMEAKSVVNIHFVGPVKHDLHFFVLHEYTIEVVACSPFTHLSVPVATPLASLSSMVRQTDTIVNIHVRILDIGDVQTWRNDKKSGTVCKYTVTDETGVVKLASWSDDQHRMMIEGFTAMSVLIVGASLKKGTPPWSVFQLNLNASAPIFIISSNKVVQSSSIRLDVPASTPVSEIGEITGAGDTFLSLNDLSVQGSEESSHNGDTVWRFDCSTSRGAMVAIECWGPKNFALPGDIRQVIKFSVTHVRVRGETRNMPLLRTTKNLSVIYDIDMCQPSAPPTPASPTPKRTREADVNEFM